MKTAKLVLRPTKSEIIIDGFELAQCVQSVNLSAGVGQVPMLGLELVLYEIDYEGEVTVTVPPQTRDALVEIGWTPPAGDTAGQPR